jgi:hypothetical protein
LKRCARRVIQTNARSAIILSVTFVPSLFLCVENLTRLLCDAAACSLVSPCSKAMEFTDGQLRNPSLANYKIPGIRDLPLKPEARAKAAARDCADAAQ